MSQAQEATAKRQESIPEALKQAQTFALAAEPQFRMSTLSVRILTLLAVAAFFGAAGAGVAFYLLS